MHSPKIPGVGSCRSREKLQSEGTRFIIICQALKTNVQPFFHTFEFLLQCSEDSINPGKLLGKSRRRKYHTRFQNTMGWWSTKSGTVITWSPSFSNKLSSSFHTTRGLRYGTVMGSGLCKRHSNPKGSYWIYKEIKRNFFVFIITFHLFSEELKVTYMVLSNPTLPILPSQQSCEVG